MGSAAKPPFAQLEEAIFEILRKKRERADEMRRNASHLGADTAIVEVMGEVGVTLLDAVPNFANAKKEFLELARESMETIMHWLIIAAHTKRNMGSLNPVWALDQLQLKLKRVLDKIRPKLM